MIEIKKKDVNDLIVYLQKNYGLYFVEFREAPNGKKTIILCNPKNKDWWISILLDGFFKAHVYLGTTGNVDKKKLMHDIFDEKYKGYGRKYVGNWLCL